MAPHSKAFTLIELLVVITIIVVLLALLTPALDRAIYSAELAACGANLKGVGTGLTVYASEHKRAYPDRKFPDSRAISLGGPFADGGLFNGETSFDLRPRLAPYLSLKMLIDPLCDPVDLSVESNDPLLVYTYSSNWLWFNWKFDAATKASTRQGDRMEWADIDGKTYAFDLLATDGQAIFESGQISQNSHPDKQGRSRSVAWFQEPGAGFLTYSSWQQDDIRLGSEMDCNFLRLDLSVDRLDGLIYDGTVGTMDERLVKVPERHSGYEPTRVNYLPRL